MILIRHACCISVIINMQSLLLATFYNFVTLNWLYKVKKNQGSAQGNTLPLAQIVALCRRINSRDSLAGHSFFFMLCTCSNRFLLFPKNLLENFAGSGWPNYPPHLQFTGIFNRIFFFHATVESLPLKETLKQKPVFIIILIKTVQQGVGFKFKEESF